MRAGTQPLGSAILRAVPLLSLLERTLGVDRRGLVWVLTTIALVAPAVLVPLVDRHIRRKR